eukprot:gene18446-37378_t
MPEWKRPFQKLEIGKGRKIKDGEEVVILTIGHIGNYAVKACEMLEKEGINPAHYDLRFVKPLDEAMLHEVFQKFDKVITVEDGCLQGGMGSAVLEFMIDNGYNAKVKRLGIPDRIVEHGEQIELQHECGFDHAGIANSEKLSRKIVSNKKLNDIDLTGYEQIEVFGAREHNLKNIDVSIPRNKLVVITGISGSGKSSLAFDTIYAEGQRRYMESFPAYARSFIGNMERPDVDKINGLSPVISIEQKTTSKNPRSTVGTTTEIYDFLRLFFARAGEAFSYITGNKMVKQTQDQIIDQILQQFDNQK